MIVWGVAFLGLFWVMYMESERHRKAVERKSIDRMADESRRRIPVKMLTKRNPAAGTAGKARGLWKKHNPIVAPGRWNVNGILG